MMKREPISLKSRGKINSKATDNFQHRIGEKHFLSRAEET
jgi:hypothetical protein